MNLIELLPNTASRVTFQSGGNVGIGNGNPQGKLDVGGGIYANTANDNILCDISLGGNNSSYGSIGYNVRFGSSYTYCTSDYSSKLYFQNGGIVFQTAPSGTAGNPITYTNVMTVLQNGNVGIGTTNPYSRLQVSGPDAASSTSAFAVVNSASTTVFAVFDGGNAQLSGTLTQSSDARLKTNIQSLDGSSTLALIAELNPVTFNWIDPNQGLGPQVGFIAQQVQQIFPELVSTTSATALTPGGTLGLNYIGLISPIIAAIQALEHEITALAATVAGFAQNFATQTLVADNGTFKQITTDKLCVTKSNGTPVCVTGDALDQLLTRESVSPTAASSLVSAASPTPVSQTASSSPTVEHATTTPSTSDATSTLPVIDNAPSIVPNYNDASTSLPVVASSTAQ